jgi:hypothetical protein
MIASAEDATMAASRRISASGLPCCGSSPLAPLRSPIVSRFAMGASSFAGPSSVAEGAGSITVFVHNCYLDALGIRRSYTSFTKLIRIPAEKLEMDRTFASRYSSGGASIANTHFITDQVILHKSLTMGCFGPGSPYWEIGAYDQKGT